MLFAKVASFKFNSATPRRKLQAVDSVVPFELATTVSQVTGTMNVYRLSQDGAAEGSGMVAPISELTREKYFSCILIDITSGFVVFQADQCSVEEQSWSADARQVLAGTISFSALTYNNEVRPVG